MEKLRKLEKETNPVAKVVAPTVIPAKEDTPVEVPEGVPPPVDEEVVFQPNPGPQTKFLAATEKECLYGGSAGGGKLVRKGGLVLTPLGFKTIETLQIGDTISAPDGTEQRIVHLHPWVSVTGVRVHFHDGTYTDVAWDHLWLAWRSGESKRDESASNENLHNSKARVVETRTLKAWLDKAEWRKLHGKRPNWPLIPVTAPQPLHGIQDEELELDPYQLGYWLGDGHGQAGKNASQQFVTFTSSDVEHFNEQFFGSNYGTHKKQGTTACTFNLRGEQRKEWISVLDSLGLWGATSHTKFIPEKYLYASMEARIAMLQGLMDTDGYVDARGQLYYTSVSEELACGVANIVRSLGGTSTCYTKEVSFKGSPVSVAHTLYIKLPSTIPPFRLERKLHRCNKIDDILYKRVINIEEIGEIEGRCITVSHPSGCYVTNDYIVTHNSYALLADPCRYVHKSTHRALILRRTNDELRELIMKSQELYPRAFPGAKWSERKSSWTFPSGATIWLTYLEQDKDVYRYQGQSFTYIGVDELTQYPTSFAWDYLRSRLRTTDPEVPTYCRATTNPGGIGHTWVKKMFIDPAPPGEAFWATDITTGEVIRYPEGHPKAGEPLFKRRFIPATLYDNPYLSDSGDYEAMLLSLPEVQRKQLLHGDWDIAEGAAFAEFNRSIHVVEPFDIPRDWRRFRAADYGYSTPSAVLWFALDPNYDILYVYRELYAKGLTAVDLARAILQMEEKDKVDYGVLDSSCWHQRGFQGPTLAEQMIQTGCRWRPADRAKGSRVAGKNEIHRRLQVDPVTNLPGLIFFSNCTNLVAQFPSIPLDNKNPEDVDTKSEDHLYDALRYGVMSRPLPRSIFDDWHMGKTQPASGWQPADPVFGY